MLAQAAANLSIRHQAAHILRWLPQSDEDMLARLALCMRLLCVLKHVKDEASFVQLYGV